MKNKCNDEFKVKGILLVDKEQKTASETLKMLPSKIKQKKCYKGLHEFIASKPIKVSGNLYKTIWSCMHCGILIDNR